MVHELTQRRTHNSTVEDRKRNIPVFTWEFRFRMTKKNEETLQPSTKSLIYKKSLEKPIQLIRTIE